MGKIARDIPGATAVLHRFNLDFCCGGAKPLGTALQEKGLASDAIVQELQALMARNQAEDELNNVSDMRLIEHILDRYHDTHREQLPELIRLARRVEQVHGDRPECPNGLWLHLEKMRDLLEDHMKKEEEILFPVISRGIYALASASIDVMRKEHEGHGVALEKLDQLTRNITLPKGACNTWRALYLGLATFKADIMNHIHLENNVLFERVIQQASASPTPTHIL